MRISYWSSDVCSSDLLVRPSINFLTGSPFQRSLRSISTRLRRPGVFGLKFLSAIALDPRGHVDAVTFVESHESLLHVGALADLAAEALRLALVAQRVDGLHLHLEDLLHCRLDLRLAGIQRHHEGDLVEIGRAHV